MYWGYFRFFPFKSILHLHVGDVFPKNIIRDVDEVDSERLGDKNGVLMAFIKIRSSREWAVWGMAGWYKWLVC